MVPANVASIAFTLKIAGLGGTETATNSAFAMEF